MANALTTAGASVLGTVTTAANSVTSIFDTLHNGVSILNRYVASAAEDQQDSLKLHRKTYRTNLVRQAALEQDKLEVELEAHFAANSGSKARFDEAYKQLLTVFDDEA